MLTAVSGSRMPPTVFVAAWSFSTRTRSRRGTSRLDMMPLNTMQAFQCSDQDELGGNFWRLSKTSSVRTCIFEPGSGVPQRLCQPCNLHALHDERHLVLKAPAMQCVRDRYPAVIIPAKTTMQQFMWQRDIVG